MTVFYITLQLVSKNAIAMFHWKKWQNIFRKVAKDWRNETSAVVII